MMTQRARLKSIDRGKEVRYTLYLSREAAKGEGDVRVLGRVQLSGTGVIGEQSGDDTERATSLLDR